MIITFPIFWPHLPLRANQKKPSMLPKSIIQSTTRAKQKPPFYSVKLPLESLPNISNAGWLSFYSKLCINSRCSFSLGWSLLISTGFNQRNVTIKIILSAEYRLIWKDLDWRWETSLWLQALTKAVAARIHNNEWNEKHQGGRISRS